MTGPLQQSPEQSILCQQCCTWPAAHSERGQESHQSDECRKSPLERRIPAVIYKAAGPAALEAFHSVVTSIWEDNDMPQELRDASIVSLFKNKEAEQIVGITKESPYCPSVGRSSPASPWTVW